MNPNKKVPFNAIVAEAKKTAVARSAEPTFNHIYACWRIQKLQLVDPYGWHELTRGQLEYIRGKLAEFENKDWNAIFVEEKKRNHPIQVADLDCPAAREWMRRNMPGEDTLWTLRFSGPERVWGIFRDGAMHILFYDPHHQIKLSPKK